MSQVFTISADPNLLDIDFIFRYLNGKSYWAKGRSRAIIEKSIQNSLCFGVYEGKKQIGFARVVSDFAVFAWLMDVFIIDEYQGKGLGKKLIAFIMEYPELQNLTRWGLNTLDAHGLYRQFGFDKSQIPDLYMEKVLKPYL